jgi:hypothetical protein
LDNKRESTPDDEDDNHAYRCAKIENRGHDGVLFLLLFLMCGKQMQGSCAQKKTNSDNQINMPIHSISFASCNDRSIDILAYVYDTLVENK